MRGTCVQLRQGLSELTLKLGRETGKIRRNSQLCLTAEMAVLEAPRNRAKKRRRRQPSHRNAAVRLGGNDSGHGRIGGDASGRA